MSTNAPYLSRAVFAGTVALALVAAPAAMAMGPGNLLPSLTYPDKAAKASKVSTVSTRNAGCRLLFCSPSK